MEIALYAIVGAQIHAGPWYWVCFGIYCAIKLINALSD